MAQLEHIFKEVMLSSTNSKRNKKHATNSSDRAQVMGGEIEDDKSCHHHSTSGLNRERRLS